MSLSIDGFWKSGFWTQTFWADGFWFEGAYVPPVFTETDQSLGGKPEKKKKRRKSLYDDIEPSEIVTPDIPDIKETRAEHVAQEAKEAVPVSGEEIRGLSVMVDAFAKAGIRTPEQIISEQETIDKRRKFNLAAIILLLD